MTTRIFAILLAGLFVLSGCGVPDTSGGKVYRIRNAPKVQFRMLDSINALRTAAGAQTVQLDAKLNAAAATHSRDMSNQNRPWHFGSDGSSPLDRVVRAGFQGQLVGEVISETYETELETLAAWMDEKGTREVIMDRSANAMGFSWFQESNGKIWYTLIMGSTLPSTAGS